jgi:ABC-type transport system substrate-binding protein
VVTRAAPTAVPKQAQTGKLATDKLIAVLATPTKQSALDCQVTGSATVNHRPSVEYLLGVDHATGEITNMLAEEWEASEDLRSFKVKLRKGVQFHDGLGEFTAKDVVHSWNYYTNDTCKASYSDYFRNDPGSDI